MSVEASKSAVVHRLSRDGEENGLWQVFLPVFLVTGGYYLGAKVGLALTFEPNALSALWPPNAILLAALLLAPMRMWWLLLAAVLPVHVLVEAQGDVPLALILGWYVSNVSEALIGAICVRKLSLALKFDTIYDTGIFILYAGILAPFLSSFVDAAFVTYNKADAGGYWNLWLDRFFSNVLAELAIVPFIVTLANGGLRSLWKSSVSDVVEYLVLAAGLLAVSLVVFDAAAKSSVLTGLLYLPLPFMLWAAVRFGSGGSSAAFMLVALLLIWGTRNGHGPFVGEDARENLRSMQMFLALCCSTLLMFAAGIRERRATAAELRSSEARLSAAFRFNPDAMLISRKSNGQLVDVNDRFLKMFNYSRDEIVGKTTLDMNLYVQPQDRRDLFRAGGASGIVRNYPLTLRMRSGELLNTVLSVEPLEIDHEPCFITIIRDVTELKRAVETLKNHDQRYQLVMQATHDVIYDWNLSENKLWWNQNGEVFFGKYSDKNPWSVATAAQLVHPEDRERLVSMVNSLRTEQTEGYTAEFRLRRVDGSYAQVCGRGFVFKVVGRDSVRIIGSITDMTDRQRAEEASQQLAHVSRLAVMGELTASIAHEINQPLGAILTNTDAAEILLNEQNVPINELRRIIEDIRHDDMRIVEVIRHMRTLMRRRKLTMQLFDLNQAIGDVLNLVHGDLARHRIAVDSEFGPLPMVYGDEVHIQQVVINLILNGVDAMADIPVSQRRLCIKTLRADGGGVLVTVTDSGTGIAADDADRLFESFFTTKREGMGLGLSIARSIIDAHGGTIRAEAAAAGGACFYFTLPPHAESTEATTS